MIDERRYAEGELAPLKNLAAALFRLENSRTPKAMDAVAGGFARMAGRARAVAAAGLRRLV